jgi:hypothetical protein
MNQYIKKIHWLKNQLGLSEDEYRAALGSYGVESSKDLLEWQARDLIKALLRLLPKEKARIIRDKKKYDELGIRYDAKRKQYYATPKQLRMIEALWMTSPAVRNKNEKAMLKFIKRITGVDRMEWIMMEDVKKVVKAIKSLNVDSHLRGNG